ncbi:MAG: hypothetical protein WCD79_04290 [Chthoniobacteraceae bacterium]
MRSFFKYLIPMLLCIAFASALSYVAFYGFWIGARVFHSVPVARACDAVGAVILIPARFIYWCSGGLADQSIPLADPQGYSMTNGIFLGSVLYALIRPMLQRKGKPVN